VNKPVNNPRRKRLLVVLTVAVLGLVIIVAAGAWYLSSAHFHDWVRARVETRLAEMTGGRVEIERFDWNLRRLEFDVRNLTIHGLEGPEQAPYLHADRLLVHARIVSLFRRDIALNLVSIEHPVLHLIIYPDGHTNQPRPKPAAIGTGTAPTQAIFELAIQHAEIRNGVLMVNDRAAPLELNANELHASMVREPGTDRYHGIVQVQIEQANYGDLRPAGASVDVDFNLLSNELDVNGLHVVAGNSTLDATAKLVDFAQPALSANYRARLDGPQIGKTVRLPELRRGQFDLNGTGTYEHSEFHSAGKIVAHQIDYRVPGLSLNNVDAAADYRVDEKTLSLTHVVGRALGGVAKGDLTVTNWQARERLNPAKGVVVQEGLLKLTVSGAPAGMAAAGFSTPKLDLTALHAVGTGSGTITGRWRGSASRAILDLDLTVVPPPESNPDEMPVRADLKGSYEVGPERLRAQSLHIATPYLRISGNGTIGARTESLHLAAEVSDLSRLHPILRMLRAQDHVAGELRGRLSFDGELSGKLLDPSVDGHLQLGDFTFPLAAIWTPPPPLQVVGEPILRVTHPKFVHIDSGEADLALSSSGLIVRNGRVARAGARANIEFSIGLTDGTFTDASRIAAHLIVHNADVAELQQIAGYSYPISGMLATDVQVVGTRLNPQGGGHLQVSNGLLYGETIRSVSADVRFLEQEARINNFQLLHERGQINGSGAYNLNSEMFRFQVLGSNFELSGIQHLNRNHVSMTGQLNFNASGSGTLNAPIVNASARLHNLFVNDQRFGDASLLAVTQGDVLHLTARSSFQTAALDLDGTVRLHDDIPVKLKVQFSNFDFMPFLQSASQGKMSGQSYLGGTLLIEGPLRDLTKLTVRAEIPKLTAQMGGVEIHNAEPITATMVNEVVRFENFHLVGTDTQFTAGGTIDFNRNGRLDFRADGRLNLKLAQSFNSGVNSSGFVDINIVANGLVNKPNIVGELKVTNGTLSLIDFPNGLSNINGSMVFNEERLQVQTLTARTGGGDLRIGGYATYSPRIAFSITAQGEDIRLRYPQGVSSTANLDLKLQGNLNSSVLSGDVTVTRFSFNNQFDLATFIAKSNRPQETARVSSLNNVRFNLHVASTPQLQVQSSLAKVAGNADLQIRGTPANPIVLGRINLTEGQVDFNGATYRIDRGDVTFLNPAHTEPSIDLAATTRVRDYDITFRVNGLASKPLKPSFSSDPPLPEADIINLLAFGQTREEAQLASTQGSSTMTETVSNTILGQAFNAAVSSRVQKLFGVSRVKIAPEIGGAQTNPTAQITIEQQVSNKITMTYITNLTQASQQAIFLEYNLDRNVSLIGGRDQYGVVSFDIRIRQRKR
jgi:translocation and assembly module TamB